MSKYIISVKLSAKTYYNIIRSYPLSCMELYDMVFDYVLKRVGNRGTAAWIAGSVSKQLDDAAQKQLRIFGTLSLEA